MKEKSTERVRASRFTPGLVARVLLGEGAARLLSGISGEISVIIFCTE